MDYSDEDSDEDPEYLPSDAEDDSGDDYGTAARTQDRCQYIQRYKDELTNLHGEMVSQGQQLMGPAFLQLCDFTTFANFCYKNTTP
jgi:hypothetical protein